MKHPFKDPKWLHMCRMSKLVFDMRFVRQTETQHDICLRDSTSVSLPVSVVCHSNKRL